MKSLKIAAVVAALCLTGCGDAGDGQKIGTVIRFGTHGFFCKTWEGELIRGGFNGGTGATAGIFHFTVENPNIVPQIQKAMDDQTEVKITFHTERATFCRSDSEDDFITKVEPWGRAPTTIQIQPKDEESQNDKVQKLIKQNQLLLNTLKSLTEDKQ